MYELSLDWIAMLIVAIYMHGDVGWMILMKIEKEKSSSVNIFCHCTLRVNYEK